MVKLDIIHCFKNRNIKDRKTLKDIVEYIRNPDESHKALVSTARVLGKNHSFYDQIKSQLPCLIPNFNFKDNYVIGANISTPTGYLYIDVDDNLTINLNSNYITAYWRSLSGNGYSIIVSVSGLSKDNYKDSTLYVAKHLGINLDTQAISIDRNCVISYDDNCYYNEDADILPIDLKRLPVENSPSNTPNTHRVTTVLDSSKIIVNTKQLLIDSTKFYGELFVDLGDKVSYATIGSSFIKIPNGKRNGSLFFVGCQLKALNPSIDKKVYYKYMSSVNKNGCAVPVSNKELKTICRNVYRKFDLGELKVINNMSCRFLFNPDYNLSSKEKRSIIMKYINEQKVERNKSKIDTYIKASGLTSTSVIARELKMSRDTIIKYKKILGYYEN